MKRTNNFRTNKSGRALLISAVLGILAGTGSCSHKQEQRTNEHDNEPALTTAGDTSVQSQTISGNTERSFKVKTVKDGRDTPEIKCSVEIDYPVSGEEPLLSSARKLVLESVGIKEQTDMDDAQGIAQKAVKASISEIELPESEPSSPYEITNTVKLKYRTDKFVTFLIKGYSYTGGAHGLSFACYKTINAKTGKVLEWNDIFAPSVRTRVQKMVRKALVKQYYNGDGSSLDVLSPFTLPENAPALTPEGIRFDYNLYEIDCYAAGMPGCVIPYSMVRPLMTENARLLIPQSAGKK